MQENITPHAIASVENEVYFQGRLDEAMQVKDQNQRYFTTLKDPEFDGFEEFRVAAVDGLGTEQTQTLKALGGGAILLPMRT